jgi:hypothetical protein
LTICFILISLQLLPIMTLHKLKSFWTTSVWGISLKNLSLLYESQARLYYSWTHESTAFYKFHSAPSINHQVFCYFLCQSLGKALIHPSVFVAAKRVLTNRCLAMNYFVTLCWSENVNRKPRRTLEDVIKIYLNELGMD